MHTYTIICKHYTLYKFLSYPTYMYIDAEIAQIKNRTLSCNMVTLCITQYGSTAYLGMTRVVSGQFPHIENVWHGDTAKRDCEEPKEHHNSTKGELGYTLIPTMHA